MEGKDSCFFVPVCVGFYLILSAWRKGWESGIAFVTFGVLEGKRDMEKEMEKHKGRRFYFFSLVGYIRVWHHIALMYEGEKELTRVSQ